MSSYIGATLQECPHSTRAIARNLSESRALIATIKCHRVHARCHKSTTSFFQALRLIGGDPAFSYNLLGEHYFWSQPVLVTLPEDYTGFFAAYRDIVSVPLLIILSGLF